MKVAGRPRVASASFGAGLRELVKVPELSEPGREAAQAFPEVHLGLVTQFGARAGEVGVGPLDVARLRGPPVDDRLFAQGPFQLLDQLRQRHRLGAAEVVDAVAVAVLQGGDDAGDRVVYVGVITTGRTVAEYRDGLAGADQPRELVDRQVGALPRAVDREETQAKHGQFVQVPEGVTQQLARPLGGGVGADRLGHGVFLAERDARQIAVDAGAGGEQELLHAVLHRRLEQVGRALDVDPGVIGRLLDRRPHARHRRQVQDRCRFGPGNELVDPGAARDVDLLYLQRRVAARPCVDALEVHLLPGAVV